jgi:hypothetical protein
MDILKEVIKKEEAGITRPLPHLRVFQNVISGIFIIPPIYLAFALIQKREKYWKPMRGPEPSQKAPY